MQWIWSDILPLRYARCIYFVSMAPSEGEIELLSQKGLSFQKVNFEKRISLWIFSRKDTLASSLTRFSIYPHRRWVELSIIIKTLKKTSIKKRSWSSKIMLNESAEYLNSMPINTCLIGKSFYKQNVFWALQSLEAGRYCMEAGC